MLLFQAAAPAGQAPAGGAATGAAPATGAMGGGMAGIEGEAAKVSHGLSAASSWLQHLSAKQCTCAKRAHVMVMT